MKMTALSMMRAPRVARILRGTRSPAAFALMLAVLVTSTPAMSCELSLVVPVYDGQTWTGGCNVRINGVVWPESGCPPVNRIHWNWGDGHEDDQWFPGAHTYERSGGYIVTVTPYDSQGGSVSEQIEVSLNSCSPLGPVDPVLYSTDFQSFAYGTVNGQDEWTVGFLSCPDCPYPDPLSPDGTIVDTGSAQKALQVLAAPGWGDEVGRYYSEATKSFLAISFDFQTRDDGGPFWFMDNNEHWIGQGVESVYFWPDWVRSNASPGIGALPHSRESWHRTGIEIDRQTSQIIAIFFDGSWISDDDSTSPQVSSFHNLFYFRGVGAGERLWIDNLWISESDVPRSSRGAAERLKSTTASLPPDVFVNENQQGALDSKLSAVFAMIEDGDYVGARDKLQHDILGKTDGCAQQGEPDQNDWITDCQSQEQLYPLILDTLDLIEGLV